MSYTKRIIFNAVTYLPLVDKIPVVRRIIGRRTFGTGGTVSGRRSKGCLSRRGQIPP